MKHMTAMALAFLLSTAASAATSARAVSNEAPESDRMASLSRMIGSEVVDSEGRRIGEIEEVMIDTANKQAAYAVVDSGDWIGFGERRATVPVARALGYGVNGRLVIRGGPLRSQGPGLRPRLHRGTEILEAKLEDWDGRDLGEVRDLMFDMADGAIDTAVVQVDEGFGRSRRVAIGMPAVQHERVGSDDLVLTANRRDLDAALARKQERR